VDIRGVAPLLQVFDMPAALHFYRDVLGFEIWCRSGPGDDCDWVGLRLHGAELMLNTAYGADKRPPDRVTRPNSLLWNRSVRGRFELKTKLFSNTILGHYPT
jgi:catechol 2,3-dioxygenase-like lactoylglutathione lyase family enzyme